MPQTTQRLLDGPCPSDLELLTYQRSELVAPSRRHVLLAVEPQILAALERLITRRHQRSVLLLAYRVHRFTDVPYDVEAVENDLLRRRRHLRSRRLNVGLPHVHRHRLDAVKLLLCQSRVVAVETLLRAVFGDVLHRALLQVADQRQVPVPLGRRLLVDADPAHDLRRFALPPPRDGALHNAPGLIPADPQDLRGSRHVALPQHFDGEALEEQRESRPRLRPWHRDLDHPVFPAGHPWDARVQMGLELAAVEMAPGPLLGVIVQRQRLGAVRARPHRVIWVLGPHVHALPCDVQMDAAHGDCKPSRY